MPDPKDTSLLLRSKGFMDALADGIDPFTGLPAGQEAMQNPRIRACFSYLSEVLDQYELCLESMPPKSVRSQLFSLTEEQAARLKPRSGNCMVSTIADSITAAAGKGAKKFQTRWISNWLAACGYLEKSEDGSRVATEMGKELGIISTFRPAEPPPVEADGKAKSSAAPEQVQIQEQAQEQEQQLEQEQKQKQEQNQEQTAADSVPADSRQGEELPPPDTDPGAGKRRGRDGYYVCTYTPQAQEFIYSHLSEILAFQYNGIEVAKAAFRIISYPNRVSVANFAANHADQLLLAASGYHLAAQNRGGYLAVLRYQGHARVLEQENLPGLSAHHCALLGLQAAASQIRRPSNVLLLTSFQAGFQRPDHPDYVLCRSILETLAQAGCRIQIATCANRGDELAQYIRSLQRADEPPGAV